MITFKIYSAKEQGSLSKGEIIAVQSLETFENQQEVGQGTERIIPYNIYYGCKCISFT